MLKGLIKPGRIKTKKLFINSISRIKRYSGTKPPTTYIVITNKVVINFLEKKYFLLRTYATITMERTLNKVPIRALKTYIKVACPIVG